MNITGDRCRCRRGYIVRHNPPKQRGLKERRESLSVRISKPKLSPPICGGGVKRRNDD